MNTKIKVVSQNLNNHFRKNYSSRKTNENMKEKERIIQSYDLTKSPEVNPANSMAQKK